MTDSKQENSQSLFGMTCDADFASLHLLGIPWEATVSYGSGTALAPKAIIEASSQIDLYDPELGLACAAGVYFHPISRVVQNLNTEATALRDRIRHLAQGPERSELLEQANKLGATLNQWVQKQTTHLKNDGKIVGLVGGEHSIPLGAYRALSESVGSFSIVQIDAHADLRRAYEGFEFSHASIMHNTLCSIPGITKLVQIGVRDLSEEEFLFATAQKDAVFTCYDAQIARARFEGRPWKETVDSAIQQLADQVWISLDVDGLDPALCPSTGTPVPGGLSFNELVYLLRQIVLSDKKIIGFDLCETVPSQNGTSEWDANVAMRLLYKLCSWTLKSNNL